MDVGSPNDFSDQYKDIAVRRKRLEEEMEKVRIGMAGVLQKVGAVKGRMNEIYLKLQDVQEKQMADMNELAKEEADIEDQIAELQKVYIRGLNTTYANTRLIINGKATILHEDVRGACFRNIGGMIQSTRG